MPTEVYGGGQDADARGATNCPNCGTLMPADMRFCRACGTRLGEGVEDYTETVPLRGAPDTSRPGKSRTASAAGGKPWGGVEFSVGGNAVKPLTGALGGTKLHRVCRRVPRWVVWVFLPIIVFSIMGGFFSKQSLRNRTRGTGSSAASSAPRSHLGADFKTTDGGVLLQYVSPPGSAADKAGLIGGDLIVSFDGQPVKSESDLSNLLRATPVGKTVEVVYVRDGETKKARLTTVSENENEGFRAAFADRPKGFLGVDGDELTRVQVGGTNVYGVRMNEVYKNRPAYIAGLRAGDVVIEFDGVPIRTTGEFNMRIDRATPDSTVKVVIMRDGQRLEIPVKMGEE